MTQPRKHTPTQGKPSYPELLAQLQTLTADLQALREQGIATLTPMVQELVHSGSSNVQRIEHTLDQLLDLACLPKGLALFKTLCRHYWALDPHATADYVHLYREMWDDEAPDDSNEVVP